ncbi:MAG: transposase [Gemmatimonadetes bacterium]|nr:transposase [Gemmatimonadota bacterium]
MLRDFLWQQAERRLDQMICRHERPLAVWDESVWEKPESSALEGLCSVRSSEAERLKRIRKGYYSPPQGKVFVPGMQWLGLLLVGRRGPPQLAAMRWWTTRGERAEAKRDVEVSLLERCAEAWAGAVVHIFDRGFAGAPWLAACARTGVRFVMRWPTRYQLWDLLGEGKPAWQFTRGKRTRHWKPLWDAHARRWHRTGVIWIPVRHPAYPGPLWLVVSRRGTGKKPWYLLTNEYVDSPEHAWDVVLSYARRWQIEMTWRFLKHELAMESPRLWKWENRQKLLLMVSLVYAFLLSLLSPELKELREELLHRFCPRTGKRSRDASAPLYRLRTAICDLWSAFLLDCARVTLNSG